MDPFPHRPGQLIESARRPDRFGRPQVHPRPDVVAFHDLPRGREGDAGWTSKKHANPAPVSARHASRDHPGRVSFETDFVIDDSRIRGHAAFEDHRFFDLIEVSRERVGAVGGVCSGRERGSGGRGGHDQRAQGNAIRESDRRGRDKDGKRQGRHERRRHLRPGREGTGDKAHGEEEEGLRMESHRPRCCRVGGLAHRRACDGSTGVPGDTVDRVVSAYGSGCPCPRR